MARRNSALSMKRRNTLLRGWPSLSLKAMRPPWRAKSAGMRPAGAAVFAGAAPSSARSCEIRVATEVMLDTTRAVLIAGPTASGKSALAVAVAERLGGIVITARVQSATPALGMGYELDAIAAVVIGGTSLSGGVGTITGTLLGVLLIGVGLQAIAIVVLMAAFYFSHR